MSEDHYDTNILRWRSLLSAFEFSLYHFKFTLRNDQKFSSLSTYNNWMKMIVWGRNGCCLGNCLEVFERCLANTGFPLLPMEWSRLTDKLWRQCKLLDKLLQWKLRSLFHHQRSHHLSAPMFERTLENVIITLFTVGRKLWASMQPTLSLFIAKHHSRVQLKNPVSGGNFGGFKAQLWDVDQRV
jgi:hypothetical protein